MPVEEKQAVAAVLNGKYTMTGEAFEPVEVDMGRSAGNNIIQAGAAAWSTRDKETYDPTDDIETYALNASGVVNIIVFDPKGWALFRSFKAVKEKLDTRRGSNSELETALKDLGEAVSYKGMYGDVAIVVYSGQYIEDDTKKNYLPDLSMVLGNTPGPAACAPTAAFRMWMPSVKALTLPRVIRKTGYRQAIRRVSSP